MDHDFLNSTLEWVKDGIAGFGLSIAGAAMMPEVIHGFSVILTGAISTIIIFFINRGLKKIFK